LPSSSSRAYIACQKEKPLAVELGLSIKDCVQSVSAVKLTIAKSPESCIINEKISELCSALLADTYLLDLPIKKLTASSSSLRLYVGEALFKLNIGVIVHLPYYLTGEVQSKIQLKGKQLLKQRIQLLNLLKMHQLKSI